jgi:hypothetical protein
MARSLPKGTEAMPIRRSPNGAGYTRPQPGRDRPEWVVAINRNAWSQSIGIGGRNQPVRAHSPCEIYEYATLATYSLYLEQKVEVHARQRTTLN